MFEVLEVRNDGTAVVSTRGLRRVVIQPGGEVAQEMQPPELAKAYADAYNSWPGTCRAVVQTYAQAARTSGKRRQRAANAK